MQSSGLEDGHASHVCGIVPPSLLMHMRNAAAASPRVKGAAARTLVHSHTFRAHRGQAHLNSSGPSHGGHRGIVPPGIFQAVLDSPDTSANEKQRAQTNLSVAAAFRAARGQGITTAAEPETTRGLFRILYNANKHSRLPGKEVREEGEEISAAFKTDADFQRVWDGFAATYTLYKEVFNRNSIDDAGMDLVASIHFDDDDHPPGFDNAMFDSRLRQMIFGDGDGEIFGSFTSSIDVIAHELTHGVTDLTAGLPYMMQSGALNESISDVFGSMVKQFSKNQSAEEADWLIGEGLFVDSEKNPALRSMAAPGTAFSDVFGRGDDQPAHMRDYHHLKNDEDHDNGGVHTNSGIPNHAFYLAAMEMGGKSWETAGPVWYRALIDERLRAFVTRTANLDKVFAFFAELTVEFAGGVEGGEAAVKGAWEKVGVL